MSSVSDLHDNKTKPERDENDKVETGSDSTSYLDEAKGTTTTPADVYDSTDHRDVTTGGKNKKKEQDVDEEGVKDEEMTTKNRLEPSPRRENKKDGATPGKIPERKAPAVIMDEKDTSECPGKTAYQKESGIEQDIPENKRKGSEPSYVPAKGKDGSEKHGITAEVNKGVADVDHDVTEDPSQPLLGHEKADDADESIRKDIEFADEADDICVTEEMPENFTSEASVKKIDNPDISYPNSDKQKQKQPIIVVAEGDYLPQDTRSGGEVKKTVFPDICRGDDVDTKHQHVPVIVLGKDDVPKPCSPSRGKSKSPLDSHSAKKDRVKIPDEEEAGSSKDSNPITVTPKSVIEDPSEQRMERSERKMSDVSDVVHEVPNTNILVACLITMCFNLPLGAVAIYYSLMAAKAYRDGMRKKGAQRTRTSMLISLLALVITVLIVMFLVLWMSINKKKFKRKYASKPSFSL